MSDTPTPVDEPEAAGPSSPEPPPAAPPSAAPAQPSSMTVGGVLGEAFSLYTRFFTRFFTLALAVFLVLNLVTALAAAALLEGSGGAALFGAISIAVAIVGTFWLQGALVFASRTSATEAWTSRSETCSGR